MSQFKQISFGCNFKTLKYNDKENVFLDLSRCNILNDDIFHKI